MGPNEVKFDTRLPVDVQLAIIDYLDSIDILHLQLTNRHFGILVETYAESIWKTCLRRLCARHKWYWPSYKDITNAAGFKRICTDGWNLKRLYDEAVANGVSLAPKTQNIAFHDLGGLSPTRTLDPEIGVPFSNVHFIGGGRFLVTSEDDGPVSFWDLQGPQTDNDEITATLVTQRAMDHEGYVSCVYADEAESLHLLYISAHGGDNGGQPNSTTGGSNSLPIERYEILKVRHQQEHDSFEMLSVGALSVETLGTDEVYLESGFLTHSEDNAAMVWDFANNLCGGWGHKIPGVTLILTSDSFILLLNDIGVYGFPMPHMYPIPKDRQISVQTFAEHPMESAFVLHHETSPPIPRPVNFIGCHSAVEENVPSFYELFAPSGDGYTAQRYRLVLRTILEDSTLDRVQVTECPEPEGPLGRSSLKVQSYVPYWDRLWTFWEDSAKHTISIACSPSMTRFASLTLPDEGEPDHCKLNPVLFATHGPETKCLGCELDLGSRRAVAVCEIGEKCWIEMYTF